MWNRRKSINFSELFFTGNDHVFRRHEKTPLLKTGFAAGFGKHELMNPLACQKKMFSNGSGFRDWACGFSETYI